MAILLERGPIEQMALEVEAVVGGGLEIEEALGRAGRFEPLHLAFASPDRLMRIFRSVVGSFAGDMLCRQAQLAERGTIGSKPVGGDPGWRQLPLQKLAHQ